MAKLGISIKIDVTKIDKSRLFKGQKGTYLDLTTFIDTEQVDQYGDNGFVSHSKSKDERERGVQTPILGNCRVFFNDSQQAPQQQPQQQSQHPQGDYQHQARQQPQQQQGVDPQGNPPPLDDGWNDDIPFL